MATLAEAIKNNCPRDPHRPRVQAQGDKLCLAEFQIVEQLLRQPVGRPLHLLEAALNFFDGLRPMVFQKLGNVEKLPHAE